MLTRIDCAHLLTADEHQPYVPAAAVLVRGDAIAWAGPGAQCPATREQADQWLDFSDKIIIPGLVNTHGHSSLNCMRGVSDAGDFTQWAGELKAYTSDLTPEALHFGNLLSVMDMLAGGTTCICDCTRYGIGGLSRAAELFGMRSLAGGLANSPELRTDGQGNWDDIVAWCDAADICPDRSTLVNVYIGAHSPYNCTGELLKTAHAQARQRGLLFVIHAAETKAEESTILQRYGMRPIPWLHSLGVLDENTLLVHSVWLNEEEIALISHCGCKVAHCPASNMKLGSGVAPIKKMVRSGITVGLGTDSMLSNNSLDLFSEMKIASLVDRITYGPDCLDNRQLFHMATIEGARALRMDRWIGSICAGKKADLAVLNGYHPLGYDEQRLLSDLVFYMNRDSVYATMVNGTLVYRDGRFLLQDGEAVREQAKRYFEESEKYRKLLHGEAREKGDRK